RKQTAPPDHSHSRLKERRRVRGSWRMYSGNEPLKSTMYLGKSWEGTYLTAFCTSPTDGNRLVVGIASMMITSQSALNVSSGIDTSVNSGGMSVTCWSSTNARNLRLKRQ